MFQEIPLIHALAARDALVMLPENLRNVADVYRWPEDQGKRVAFGSTYHRTTKPVLNQLNPVLEDSLLKPIVEAREPEMHYFDTEKRTGQLHVSLSTSFAQMKAFMQVPSNRNQLVQVMGMLGQVTHWMVDSWNPFQLSSGPVAEGLASRFVEDLASHPDDLRFLWRVLGTEIKKGHPYMDPKLTGMSFEYRKGIVEQTGQFYLIGNGWPAAREWASDLWDDMVNDIASAWIFLCA